MPFGVRRFSPSKATTTNTPAVPPTASPEELVRNEAHSHVVTELEQVIEKDRQRAAAMAAASGAGNTRARGGGNVGEEESVCSRFSNRYEDEEAPSPGRQYRNSRGQSGARQSRRISRAAPSRQYYGDSGDEYDDHYPEDEEVSPRRAAGRSQRYSRRSSSGANSESALVVHQKPGVVVVEDGEEEAGGCCKGVRTCFKVTYDIFRSIPLLTLVWAGGAIAASNLGVSKVQTVGMNISILQNLEGLFMYMTYFLYYIYAVNAAIALLSLLFTGATLEILVGKFCSTRGCGGGFKRFSVRSVQAFFFPLSYIGFLATLGLFLLTVLLASLVLMTNQACGAGASLGADAAAASLSTELNTVTNWMGLKSVAISGAELAGYCASPHTLSSWFWRMTFIYVAAATIFQANLAVSAWTIFLNTGHEMKKAELGRAHAEQLTQVLAKAGREGGVMMKRPRSVSGMGGRGRPYASSRAEAKEAEYYYDDDIC
eukprot:evm.model.NODE_41868_length_6814_cov_36.834164.1